MTWGRLMKYIKCVLAVISWFDYLLCTFCTTGLLKGYVELEVSNVLRYLLIDQRWSWVRDRLIVLSTRLSGHVGGQWTFL